MGINLNVRFIVVSRADLYSLQVGGGIVLLFSLISLLSLLEAGRPEDKLEYLYYISIVITGSWETRR